MASLSRNPLKSEAFTDSCSEPNIDRSVRFGLTFYRAGETKWMSHDTPRHNETD